MAKPLVPHILLQRIESLPLNPKERCFRLSGRTPLEDCKALIGILFVLKTGIPWEGLPHEMGFGSGESCWRRLHDWQVAVDWQKLHDVLLAELSSNDGGSIGRVL